ncbi:transcriptional regulator [Candidatus Acidianus copahuensis]|uniref:Transcriptional regulator n=1 Tax=Candidatus Acidianus copahuensis TaxID=1160895 RepID=A0A031LNS0_9CREN|nr:PadR family transcriptional regulator [Candidatus Acidianus copahuensis]EZQ06656.1 transcriptional regulator [Candidatus Acidianus copahuensis]
MGKSELILRGVITLYVISELIDKRMNGYELEKAISERLMKEMPRGSIYVILKNASRKRLIKCEVIENSRGQKVKVYTVTDKGKEFFYKHEEPLSIAKGIIEELLERIREKKD